MLTRLRAGLPAVIALGTLLVPVARASGAEPEASPLPPAADATAPVPESRDAALARRDAAQQTFVRLTEEERYEEAVAIAGEIVDLTTRVYGQRSLELATPLSNLATAQMRLGELVGAETNYRAGIAIIEAEEGLTSMRLINPLVGLGETYMRAGLYEAANAAYRRALQTNHVQDGFYNLEQVKILDGLSESYLAIDKVGQANAQQKIQVQIARRRSGPDSPDVVQAMQKLGVWYNRTGQYPEAHLVFQDTRRVIQDSKSVDNSAMIDSLLSEAITYGNEGADASSVEAIKQALNLLDAQAEPDHSKHAEVLVALGDCYMRARQPRSGRERYTQAWQELSGDDSLIAARDRYFAKPVQIRISLLPTVIDESGRQAKKTSETPRVFSKGFVVASMTIDADGDARNVKIIESDPPGLMDKPVLRALDFAVFRPQMTDGNVVTSEDVQFRHDYRYPQSAPAAGQSPVPASRESAGEKGAPIRYPGEPDESDDDAKP